VNRTSFVRKLIAILALIGMAALLIAGCGGAATPNPVPPTAASSATAAKPTATQPAAAAWQQKWEQTVAAAKKEGKLTIYGDVSPKLRDSIMAFQNKYGIEMDFVVAMGSLIVTKWTSERSAGLSIADVFHLSSGLAPSMKPKDGWVSVEPYFILPEAKDAKAWVGDLLPYLDKDKTMVTLNYAYTSYVTVNSDLIKEGQLKSYRDIVKPEWNGKVSFFDPTVPSASLGLTVFLMKDIFGLDGAKEYFRQLAATKPVITRDAAQQMDWVVRGRYPIGVGISHSNTSDYKSRGAPVTTVRFSEGGSINAGSGLVEVPPSPPHPNATALYVNWLLTEEGQTAFARGMAASPMRKGVTFEGIDPAKVPLPGEKIFLYDEDHSNYGPEAVPVMREIFGDQLK